MHRNISRAYYALMAEHHRVRAAHMKIVAQGDAMLERKLVRAKEDDDVHIEEVVICEERLSAAQPSTGIQTEQLWQENRKAY